MVHRKQVFVLAGVFLAMALVIPPAVLVYLTSQDFNRFIVVQNDQGLVTGGNTTSNIYQLNQTIQTIYGVIIMVEAVFVVLFAVTVWYGIKHVHPDHK